MTDTATATETQVALAVAAPQSPEVELFGAGVQVREPEPLAGVRWEIRVDPEMAQRLSEAIAKCLAVPAREWRAEAYGSFAPSAGTGPSPVEQVVPAYRPEHWYSVYDWRAPAACCTPSRRPVTGGGYDGMRYVPLGRGEEGGE